MSPVKTNIPFNSRRPAQKRVTCKKGVIPNIRVRKTIAEIKSTAPSILTKTIRTLKT